MKSWFLWIVVGLVSATAGVVALFNPFVATIAAERIAAWAFLLLGILQLISAWRDAGGGGRVWAALWGALAVFIGVSLLFDPLRGVVSLTMLIAVVFLASGLVKIFLALQNRRGSYWSVLLLSGIVSVALAAMIFLNFPIAAATVLGVLLAVELLSNGVSMMVLGLMRKKGA